LVINQEGVHDEKKDEKELKRLEEERDRLHQRSVQILGSIIDSLYVVNLYNRCIIRYEI
jgi:riboflavin synthase